MENLHFAAFENSLVFNENSQTCWTIFLGLQFIREIESMARANALWNNRHFKVKRRTMRKQICDSYFHPFIRFYPLKIASMQFFNWEDEMYSSRKLIVCCLTWLSEAHLDWNGISTFFRLVLVFQSILMEFSCLFMRSNVHFNHFKNENS